ncbi:efflux RND transporter periplasmic adaptor subunit [Flavobacteriaceae bacterium SZ-1-7]|uniref:efflux RND transporter periplasmic adaptor subunit n=1 Tax=Tamlana sedimenti TaxID=3134126 RepID=UPI00312448F4
MKRIYILLFSLALSACGKSEKNNETNSIEEVNSNEIVVTQSQFENENMQLGKLEEHTFNTGIKATGTIDVPPKNKAKISTFMGGYITKTPLLAGDKVKKGQVLVSLENPEFVELQQQYLEVAEQLNYLKSEFNRQKTLFDENITSQKNFLKAESTYKSSLAHYNGLRKKLAMLNINPTSVDQGKLTSTINLYSPIEGFITKVNVSNGMPVSEADVIMEIVDTDHIHLELSVFEKDILHIKKDQKILFQIPESSDKTFEAEVHLVGTTIDETTRIVKVHGHILNESEANFIVGMFVEANILTEAFTAPALPKNAILGGEDGTFALALKEKKANNYYFEKIKLELGEETETQAVVLNAKDLENKEVLINGGFMLDGGGE